MAARTSDPEKDEGPTDKHELVPRVHGRHFSCGYQCAWRIRLTHSHHWLNIHRTIESAETSSFVLPGVETEVSALAGSTDWVMTTTASRR